MRIAGKPFTLPSDLVQQIKFISPNLNELEQIANVLDCPIKMKMDPSHCNEENFLQTLKAIATHVIGYVDNVIITLGPNGVLIVRHEFNGLKLFDDNFRYMKNSSTSNVKGRLYHVKSINDIKNVSGAGDSFNSGFISAMISGKSEEICVSVGFESAIYALRAQGAVPAKYFAKDDQCWHERAVFKEI